VPDSDRMAATGSTSRRPGRRPAGSGTREAILDAARMEFMERGYDGATVRAIAARAGVNHAMIGHFFGSKEDLFATAIDWPFDPAQDIPRVMAGDPDHVGPRLAQFFFEQLEAPRSRHTILTLLRSATSNENATRLLRDFAEREIATQIAACIDRPDAQMRSALIVSQLVGVTLMRHLIGLQPLTAAQRDAIVEPLGEALQSLIAGCGRPAPQRPRA